jgi:predicted outer membrane repeat protein
MPRFSGAEPKILYHNNYKYCDMFYRETLSLLMVLAVCGCIPAVSSADGSNGYVLQALIDKAIDGDVVQVPVGTYNENICIDKNLTLQGTDENKTIIDGNKECSVITIGPDHHVKLSKLTIMNGSAHKGGGIYIDLGSNVTAEDCMIQLNHAINSGGGVYVEVTSAFKLDGTKIFLNTASFGGGIYTDGKVMLDSGDIYHNLAFQHSDSGGGIYVDKHGIIACDIARVVYQNTPVDVNGPLKCWCCCDGTTPAYSCFTRDGDTKSVTAYCRTIKPWYTAGNCIPGTAPCSSDAKCTCQ